ncbi:unannotated protein [freshwater metagenome]|uniref:Unannotated protein n=1 Tax=freshwater metagenome TaxID=449393 RepID=A0A6J7RTG0_9ZZZZ
MRSGGGVQSDFVYMVGKTSVAVMIFAVNVGRECSPYCYETGAGGNRNKPTLGHNLAHDGIEAHSPAHSQQAGGGIEIKGNINCGGVDYIAVGVLGGVTVTATQSASHDAAMTGVSKSAIDGNSSGGSDYSGPTRRYATPAGEDSAGGVRHKYRG